MTGKIKVNIEVALPDDLLGAFLQHMRDFDTQHPGNEFAIAVDAPHLCHDEITHILDSLDPPFTHRRVIRKQ